MARINTTSIGVLFSLALLYGCNGSSATDNPSSNTSDAAQSEEGFTPMFQNESLAGWVGDTTYWRMDGDILIGEITPEQSLTDNTFLIWEGKEMSDFILKSDFKITAEGNSGINYRSEQLNEPRFAMKGYQADIDGQHRYTGQNYEERNRTTLAYRGQRTEIKDSSPESPGKSEGNAWTNLEVVDSVASESELNDIIKPNEWNEIKIVAEGNKLSHYINGLLVSETNDKDTEHRKDSGLIGVQVHVGPPMKVEYRNMRIKTLNQ